MCYLKPGGMSIFFPGWPHKAWTIFQISVVPVVPVIPVVPVVPVVPLAKGQSSRHWRANHQCKVAAPRAPLQSQSRVWVRSWYPETPQSSVCMRLYIYIHTWCRMRVDYPGIYIYICRYMNEYLDFSLDFCWTCLAKIYQNLAGYGTEQPNLETGNLSNLTYYPIAKHPPNTLIRTYTIN